MPGLGAVGSLRTRRTRWVYTGVFDELDGWIVGWVLFFCVFGYTSGFFARLGGVPVGKRVWVVPGRIEDG